MRTRHAALVFVYFAFLTATAPASEVKLLPWSQQIALRELWLQKRHQMILKNFTMTRSRNIVRRPALTLGDAIFLSSSIPALTPAKKVCARLPSLALPKKT